MYLKKKCEQCKLEKSCQAIHLEVSFSLDTDSFLHFKVWCPRRGLPRDIVCDNGTNFVGGSNELKELETLDQSWSQVAL